MDSSDIGVGKKAPTGRFSKRLTIRFTAAIVIAVGTGALYRYASILSSLRVADEELLVQPPQTLGASNNVKSESKRRGEITIAMADGRTDLTWLASVAQKKAYALKRGYGFDFDTLDFSLWDEGQAWEQLAGSMSRRGEGRFEDINVESSHDNQLQNRIRAKKPWHVDGDRKAYFVDTWAKVIHDDGRRVYTPDEFHQPWGMMPGTWNKVVGIRKAMNHAPRDSWGASIQMLSSLTWIMMA